MLKMYAVVLPTDIDSLSYKGFAENAYGAFWKDKNFFDLGEYPKY